VTVGETLSRARRAKGLSVEDVAADTCIRGTLIYAIEADNFAMCGGSVYARGHIRSIARFVGVEAEPLIAEFDAEHGEVKVPAVAPGMTAEPLLPIPRERSSRRTGAMVGVAATLVIVCALAVVGLLHGHGHRSPKPQTATRHSSTAPQQVVTTPAPDTSSVPAEPVTVSHATLKVKTSHGESWLSITTKSGKVLFSGLLPAGEQKVFTSHHDLRYVIGNAPAVDVIVNGTDIGSPPSSGLVAHGKVSPHTV
jgi:cytoskeletal protein RodZ